MLSSCSAEQHKLHQLKRGDPFPLLVGGLFPRIQNRGPIETENLSRLTLRQVTGQFSAVKSSPSDRYPTASAESKGSIFDVAKPKPKIQSQASRPASSRRIAIAFSSSLSGRLAIICIAAVKSLSAGGSVAVPASFLGCLGKTLAVLPE